MPPRSSSAQLDPVAEAARALGVAVWPMVELEADDALGAAALVAGADDRVDRVLICTPDKDLGQCVGGKVVQWDRRRDLYFDASGVREKFGVDPESIPDYLALVGDSADGFPGLAGFGSRSAAAVRPSTSTSNRFRPRARTGVSASATPDGSPRRCGRTSSWRCCSVVSRPWRRTSTSETSKTCDGPARPTSSAPSPSGWRRPSWWGGRSPAGVARSPRRTIMM